MCKKSKRTLNGFADHALQHPVHRRAPVHSEGHVNKAAASRLRVGRLTNVNVKLVAVGRCCVGLEIHHMPAITHTSSKSSPY